MGTRAGPETSAPWLAEVTPELVAALRATTGAHAGMADEGAAVPPILLFVLVLRSLQDRLANEWRLGSVLHMAQDIIVDHSLEVGSVAMVSSGIEAVRPTLTGSEVCVRSDITDESGHPRARLWTTLHSRTDLAPVAGPETRPRANRAGWPEGTERRSTLASLPGATQQYADASGDRNPIHLDEVAARAVGLPGRIRHGAHVLGQIATMIARDMSVDDRDIRRLRGRFTAPIPVGAAINIRWIVTPSEPTVVEFQAAVGGRRVVREGLLAFQSDG